LTTQGLTHSSLDVKITASDVCGELVSPSDKMLTSALPLLLQNAREKNTALKAAAETAIFKLIQSTAHLKVSTRFHGYHVKVLCCVVVSTIELQTTPVALVLDTFLSAQCQCLAPLCGLVVGFCCLLVPPSEWSALEAFVWGYVHTHTHTHTLHSVMQNGSSC